MSEELLMIFDGNNLAIRAAFGMGYKDKDGNWVSSLSTSDGRDCGALYGLVRTLRNFVIQYKPTHILWAFDHGRSSYRLGIRDTYKSNRDKDKKDNNVKFDMGYQYGAFDHFLSLMNIRHYRENNVEADDIIASATLKWQGPNRKVVIVSADHDLRQLVNENVSVLKPSMGGGKNSREKLYTIREMKEDYPEIPPHRLPEVWALTGDPGDGIAGVPRVGEITARKMLKDTTLWDILPTHPKLKGYEKLVSENYHMILLDGTVSRFNVSLEECEFSDQYILEDLEKWLLNWEFKSFLTACREGVFWNV